MRKREGGGGEELEAFLSCGREEEAKFLSGGRKVRRKERGEGGLWETNEGEERKRGASE